MRGFRAQGSGFSAWTLIPLALVCLLLCHQAAAVIRVDLGLPKIYGKDSSVVATGSITGISPEHQVLHVKTTATFKGPPLAAEFRVQIVNPRGLVAAARPGQPVVVMVYKAEPLKTLLNLAGTWVLANRVGDEKNPIFRVMQVHPNAHQGYPGRTEALVTILQQLAQDKYSLLDEVDNRVFTGGIRELMKIAGPAPRWMLGTDADGDGRADLLLRSADGLRLLRGKSGGFHDPRPADLSLPPDGDCMATAILDANGDGRPDLLRLDKAGNLEVFANIRGGSASPNRIRLWNDGPEALAAVFGDFGDTGRPHVLVATATGLTRYALDADGGPPTGFERLAAQGLDQHHKAFAAGLKHPAMVVLDSNGDRRPDVLLVADGGALLLINRGFGAFLVNPEPTALLLGIGKDAKPPPFRITPATPWTAADLSSDGRDDLLILAPDGRLFIVDNPKP